MNMLPPARASSRQIPSVRMQCVWRASVWKIAFAKLITRRRDWRGKRRKAGTFALREALVRSELVSTKQRNAESIEHDVFGNRSQRSSKPMSILSFSKHFRILKK